MEPYLHTPKRASTESFYRNSVIIIQLLSWCLLLTKGFALYYLHSIDTRITFVTLSYFLFLLLSLPQLLVSLLQNKMNSMRFQILMVVSMKMAIFWVVALCTLVKVYWCFRGAGCPDDGGSKHLWNVSELIPDYTAQQPTRQPSSRWTATESPSNTNYFYKPTQ
jgi:hypothetical protein